MVGQSNSTVAGLDEQDLGEPDNIALRYINVTHVIHVTHVTLLLNELSHAFARWAKDDSDRVRSSVIERNVIEQW